MIEKPIIYLAGSMSGLTWKEASEWRWQTEMKLKDYYEFISPVRMPNGADPNELITLQTQKDTNLHISKTATGVTAADEWYIDKADWVLANFTIAKRPSFGTVWEMGYAWGTNTKIVSVVQPGSLHDHPFVRRRSHVFTETIEEAIEYFKAISI